MTATREPVIDVHLDAEAWRTTRDEEVRRGLTSTPPTLSPVWFYDEHGSDLFDEITRLPEYYQTRTERRLLQAHAADLARHGVEVLVELGSGTSDKTVEILDALIAGGDLRTYVPFDVSDATMRDAIARLGERYPSLAFHGVVGDFHRHLGELPDGGRRLVAFLGGTIGNFRPSERAHFFAQLGGVMAVDDLLLIGIDLLKPRDRIVAAYDDAAGVTAAFNRNALVVLDRELDADLDPTAFDHVARWNEADGWIEMWLRANRPVHARVGALDLALDLAVGDEILTEISAKFAPDAFAAELAASGFEVTDIWTGTDPAAAVTAAEAGADFGLVLARRAPA